MRDEIAAYLAYVDHLKQQEQDHEEHLEELRQKELNKEWNKRELQWTKEELAREQLLQSVIQDRQDQISYNNLQKEKIKKKIEDCSDSIQLNKHVETLDIQEKEKEDERWKYNKEIQQFLNKQIEEKKSREITEQVKVLAIDDQSKKEEELYKKLLQQEKEKDQEKILKGQTSNTRSRVSANWWTF